MVNHLVELELVERRRQTEHKWGHAGCERRRRGTRPDRRVGAGGTALDPEIVELMVARARRGGDAIDALTDRQRQVLELMAAGCSNSAIARRLSVNEKSVVAHASHIYEGLGLIPDDEGHRRVQAVVQYLNR